MAVPKELELKLLVDKEKNRLLFAEADADFVDCIFSFLTFPLGTIVRLVLPTTQSQPVVTLGCFNTLYQSVMNLDTKRFFTNACKDMLVKPRNLLEEEFRKLKISVDDTEPTKYYRGQSPCFTCKSPVIYKTRIRCSYCGDLKNIETTLGPSSSTSEIRKDEVFVTKAFKFIITDHLHVMPLIPGEAIGLLYKLGIEDTNVIEERTVKLGSNQLLELLKWTLASTSPLTDMFLSKGNLPGKVTPENPPLMRRYPINQAEEVRSMEVKVMLKKSNKEVLFVEAQQEFIDILFSFLTIPLVELLHILDGQSCLRSIDSLYQSALALDSQYFMSENDKNVLLRPACSPYYKRYKQIFPSETNLGSFVIEGVTMPIVNPKFPTDDTKIGSKDLKGFVKEGLFMVMDNLVVTPFSTGTAISILNKSKCLLSNLEERTISIGMVEVLSILKASLNSTSALTNGLFDKLNLKEPKQEV